MSGRYVHNHGVATNVQPEDLDLDRTIQAYLKEAGYRTGLAGKYLNSWPAEREPPNFDRFAMSTRFEYYGGRWNVDGKVSPIGPYSTSFIADYADRFIRESSTRDVPWFLQVSSLAPHAPFIPHPRYFRTPVQEWNGNPAMSESDLNDKPPFASRELRNLNLAKGQRAAQLRTLKSVDDLVGRIHRLLERLGEERSTLAFFISDNGVLWGEHGLSHKSWPYRATVEVPFFMSWPGRVRPGMDGRMAANIDIAPTILDAAGIDPDPSVPMDGRSLLERWRRDELLLEYKFFRAFDVPPWASLRTRTSQYIEYYDDGETIFREYYDLTADPWQLDNLLADTDASNDPSIRSLQTRLRFLRSCRGSRCP